MGPSLGQQECRNGLVKQFFPLFSACHVPCVPVQERSHTGVRLVKAAELARSGARLTWAEGEEKSDFFCPELCHGRAHFFSFCTPQASMG